MINLFSKRILVLGASSMLAKATIPLLKQRGATVIPSYRLDYDLTDKVDTTECFWEAKADYVINLAGLNGNIAMNLSKPATIFYSTSLINLNILNACISHKVKKVVSVIASCAYPELDILKEEDLWKGPPNYTVECHGIAKRLLDCYSRFIRTQNDINAVTVILNNCFGPNDHYNEKGKVVSSFVKKYVNAKQQNLSEVVNWGDGTPKREFTYCKDAAEAIIQTLEKYDESIPLNIASDQEFTIRELAEKVSNIVQYDGNTVWDVTKPNGSMRKKLDTTRMHQYLKLHFTPFDVALRETVDWYTDNKEIADHRLIKW